MVNVTGAICRGCNAKGIKVVIVQWEAVFLYLIVFLCLGSCEDIN